MEVHHGLEACPRLNFSVVTSGTFDGVHRGHQKIIARLQEISHTHQGETVVITFWPHPRIVLSQGKTDLKMLSTLDEKIELLEKYGTDHLLILPFTREFSQLSSEEFIQKIYMDCVRTRKLIIGYDHRFGKNREGGFDYLTQHADRFGFTVEEIPREDIESIGISSTKIRNALLAGNIRKANQYLGHTYSLRGKVVHGDKLGREIGFPTANIEIPESYKLIPGDGIYAVKVLVQARAYQGMLYIGSRPTLEGVLEPRIEVNILDFNQDIYGEGIQVDFVERIRGDEKFASLEEMQAQLARDREDTLRIFKD